MINQRHFAGNNLMLLLAVSVCVCLIAFSNLVNSLPDNQFVIKSNSAAHWNSILRQGTSHVPLFPIQDPCEIPASEEVESKEECNDDLTKLFAVFFAKGIEGFHTKQHQLLASRTSSHNRSSVSLFILYHCWKNFPSHL